jgi:hypothetical protein
MRTASTGSDAETRRLIDGLTSEVPTDGTSQDVADAERSALSAIRKLADQVNGQNDAGRAEWTRTGRAIERWIVAASGTI